MCAVGFIYAFLKKSAEMSCKVIFGYLLLDQYERLSINLKLAKGRKTKARSGQKACGVAPLGYRWTTNAEIEIDRDGADTVKVKRGAKEINTTKIYRNHY